MADSSDAAADAAADLFVAESEYDGLVDAFVTGFAEGLGILPPDSSGLTADAESGDAAVAYSESGDAAYSYPDGEVSFSGTTPGGDSLSFDSESGIVSGTGVVDYSQGLDVGL